MEIKLTAENIKQIIKIKKLIKLEEDLIDFNVEHDDITTEKIRSCGVILEREVKDFFNNFELEIKNIIIFKNNA